MVDKASSNDALAETDGVAHKRPAHRGADLRDTVAELTERAQLISQEAGTKVAAAMKDVISAGAGIAGFAIESARDLVQFMVRRGQMTPEEGDKLLREAEEAHARRPDTEKNRPTASTIAAERAAAARAEAAARAASAAAAMPPFRSAARPVAPPAKSPPAKPAAPAKSDSVKASASVVTTKPAATRAAGKAAAKSAAKSAPKPAAKSTKPAAKAVAKGPAKPAGKTAAKPAAKSASRPAAATKTTKKGKR